jgi:hypothetical protein
LEEFSINLCSLCNTIHPLIINSYPSRFYRNPETCTNDRIKVIQILCPKAKELGKTYTKRLLPDFLIPYGVIRADKVVEATKDEDNINIEQICLILGCVDFRTGRKYLGRFSNTVSVISITLSQKLSEYPKENLIPSFHPEASPLSYTHLLIERFRELQDYIYGSRSLSLIYTLCWFLSRYWYKNNKKNPSTYVSDTTKNIDTS